MAKEEGGGWRKTMIIGAKERWRERQVELILGSGDVEEEEVDGAKKRKRIIDREANQRRIPRERGRKKKTK
jgi:hypothetical protein